MRVISGKFKGRTLLPPKGFNVRPTSDRVKETMFNILSARFNAFDGQALDLFCGSGALGIEAFSRGASDVIFADINSASVSLTKENLKKCGMQSLLANVYHADYSLALKKLEGKKFSVIFLDPPYANGYESELFELIKKYDVLKDNGIIVLEHTAKLGLPDDEKLKLVLTRDCGNTALSFFTYSDKGEK